MPSPLRTSPAALKCALVALLEAGGAASDMAGKVADHLVEAELLGHESHGARQIVLYLRRLRSGEVDGRAMPEVESDQGAIIRISGNRAFGQVAGEFAARLGIERAKEIGVCIVCLDGSGHLGRNGRWAELAAREDIGSMHFGQGIAKPGPVAPFGGSEGRLNTNPLALGLPGGASDRNIILDCSTAEISGSRIKLAFERRQMLDSNALVKPDGTLSNDPADFVEGGGAVLPFGGFKGYAISIFTELLSSVLATGGVAKPATNSLFSIYFDVDRFIGKDVYEQTIDSFRERIENTPPSVESQAVVLPGDRARGVFADRSQNGIPLSKAMASALGSGADRFDLRDVITDIMPELKRMDAFLNPVVAEKD